MPRGGETDCWCRYAVVLHKTIEILTYRVTLLQHEFAEKLMFLERLAIRMALLQSFGVLGQKLINYPNFFHINYPNFFTLKNLLALCYVLVSDGYCPY